MSWNWIRSDDLDQEAMVELEKAINYIRNKGGSLTDALKNISSSRSAGDIRDAFVRVRNAYGKLAETPTLRDWYNFWENNVGTPDKFIPRESASSLVRTAESVVAETEPVAGGIMDTVRQVLNIAGRTIADTWTSTKDKFWE